MSHARRLRRTTAAAWFVAAPLLASTTALGFDSSGPETGNIPYTLRAYAPVAGDPFVGGNCGITYHALNVDRSSCNTAWALRNGAFNYTSKIFHSAYANSAGDYTDPQGMVPQVLVCFRDPGSNTPPTDLSQCHPSEWNPTKAASGIGWVKTRHSWNAPA